MAPALNSMAFVLNLLNSTKVIVPKVMTSKVFKAMCTNTTNL